MSLAPLWAMAAALVVALVAFSIRLARHGMPRSERVARQGGTVLLGVYAMELGFFALQPLVRACIRLKVHPDVLSWTSLWLQAGAALLIARGQLGFGAWALIIGALFDSVDGQVARARGVASEAGEVLDAAVDRWAEMGLFFAYAWYYRDYLPGFLLAALGCMGSVMVSYARAKGEAVGVDAKMGLMQRHERAVYLAFGTLLSPLVASWLEKGAAHPRQHLLLAVLLLVAVLSTITSLQRTAYTRAELRRQGR